MIRLDEMNELLRESNNELKETFMEFYGNPSYDEILKLSAMEDLFRMPFSLKRFYLSYYDCLKKATSEADYEENKLTQFKRIDYNLTLIKLLSMYGQKMRNYSLFCRIRIVDDNTVLLESIGKLFVLLEAFNRIKVSEYSRYSDLFFNVPFINNICPNHYSTSNEAINIIHHNLDDPIKRYSQDYNIYDDNDRHILIKSINADINSKKRVFKG
ncbi:MAG: hypothetical protein HFI86_08170 [Bacilli bacterium]|nr:hypothetical protein [Bacilli bacterium]